MAAAIRAHQWRFGFAARAALVIALVVGAAIVAPRTARAYNDQQHQGLVALAYKAMAEAALETNNCAPPFDFPGGVPPSLRSFPGGTECTGVDETTCRARWQTFLDGLDRSVVYLRTKINASLPAPPTENCLDPRGTFLK